MDKLLMYQVIKRLDAVILIPFIDALSFEEICARLYYKFISSDDVQHGIWN